MVRNWSMRARQWPLASEPGLIQVAEVSSAGAVEPVSSLMVASPGAINITVAHSSNGVAWTTVGSVAVAFLGTPIYIGLAVIYPLQRPSRFTCEARTERMPTAFRVFGPRRSPALL